MGPDKVRGSKSIFLTSERRSLDRTILPGINDPGLRRFRGETGDGSRFRFSGGDSAAIVKTVGTDKGSVELEDRFDLVRLNTSDGAQDGIA
jgi:hypothetical protein